MGLTEFIYNLLRELDLVQEGSIKRLYLALVVTFSALALRIIMGVLASIKDVFAGRSVIMKRDRGLGLLSWWLMVGVVALPWVRVFGHHIDWHLPSAAKGIWATICFAWLAVRASDATSAWLDRNEEVIRARRGLYWLGAKQLEIKVVRVFCDGNGASPESMDSLKTGTWYIRKDVVTALRDYRGGSAEAIDFLNDVITELGGQPASLARS